MTEREIYGVIANVFETIDNENKDAVLAFTEKKVAALDAKNAKARVYAAKKRAAVDETVERIYDVIANADVITIPEIEGEVNMTQSKVVARLTKLVKAGRIEKVPVKYEGRKLTGYKVVGEDEEAIEA